MYINKYRFYILIAISCLWHDMAVADDLLHLTPNTCVTLQQGRSCHTLVQVTWQLAKPGNVCLYRQQQALQCWKNSDKAKWHWRFEYEHSQQLTLWRQGEDGQLTEKLGTAFVDVNWVHNANKKRMWRRF